VRSLALRVLEVCRGGSGGKFVSLSLIVEEWCRCELSLSCFLDFW
jgi:hypothetical protein